VDEGSCESYLRDFVIWLRNRTGEAAAESGGAAGDQFAAGRALAYVEVLGFLQSQADVFLIEREEIGLDGFDAYALLGKKAGLAEGE
jgi:hypothetical protein